MGYCILNVLIGSYNGKRRKQNSSGFKRYVWNNVCKLYAVIDYGSLSLTARQIETVTVFFVTSVHKLRKNSGKIVINHIKRREEIILRSTL